MFGNIVETNFYENKFTKQNKIIYFSNTSAKYNENEFLDLSM